jgi:hypothetical protein
MFCDAGEHVGESRLRVGATPCRRATADTLAPGSNASATIRRFSNAAPTPPRRKHGVGALRPMSRHRHRPISKLIDFGHINPLRPS